MSQCQSGRHCGVQLTHLACCLVAAPAQVRPTYRQWWMQVDSRASSPHTLSTAQPWGLRVIDHFSSGSAPCQKDEQCGATQGSPNKAATSYFDDAVANELHQHNWVCRFKFESEAGPGTANSFLASNIFSAWVGCAVSWIFSPAILSRAHLKLTRCSITSYKTLRRTFQKA